MAPAGNMLQLQAHAEIERARVVDIQRARMIVAMAEVAEQGAANVTVAQVVARSGVSRRTFYEVFEDRDDCFLATFDDALAQAAERVVPAYRPADPWRKRIRAGLVALLRFLDEEPFLGRLLIAEALAAGPGALQRRQRVVERLVAVVDEGRTEAKAVVSAPPLTAEGIVGAVLSLIHTRMLTSRSQPLLPLVNQLMAMVVLPYLGVAASRRELEHPMPDEAPPRLRAGYDPLNELGMRLTYRTVRVLMAIGSHPGASNRKVGDIAGVPDPGQISKLLSRLYQLGLIEKGGAERARGEPNAWQLTGQGEQVQRAMATQVAHA